MKKLIFIASTALFAVGLGAQTAPPAPQDVPSAISVKIESTQRFNNALKTPATVTVVEGKAPARKLRVPATARIVDAKGNPVSFDKLKKGSAATVTLAGVPDDPYVTTIQLIGEEKR